MKLMSSKLRAFMETAKHHSVSAAAFELNVTQTAVTQRIKKLEHELKLTLFIRTRRGMQLTREGELLLTYCNKCGLLEGEVLNVADKIGKDGLVSLSIQGPLTLIKYRVIPACSAIVNQYPNLLIHYHVNDDAQRVTALKNAEADFVIIDRALLTEEMTFKLLKPEEYVFVIPEQWKDRAIEEIVKTERIIDFNQQDQTTFNYLKQANLFEYAKKDRYFTNRTDTLALLIAETHGYGVLPRDFFEREGNSLKLISKKSNFNYSVPQVLAWYPREYQPSYFSSIIDACY